MKTPDSDCGGKQTVGQKLAKKYPFNRTTTPNSLREHLKETLAKNIDSSSLDETIQCFRDDEILDTFNIDSENVETPPVHRRTINNNNNSKVSEVSFFWWQRNRGIDCKWSNMESRTFTCMAI